MAKRSHDWWPAAAYLYVLHLDGPALAWEYLRRNPSYREGWQAQRSTQRGENGDPLRWGLRQFEDPQRNSRDACPEWNADTGDMLMLQPDPISQPGAMPFRLWTLPGHKRLSHEGNHLVMTTLLGGRTLRTAIAVTLGDGMAFAFAVHSGASLRQRWRAVETDVGMLETPGTHLPIQAKNRPGRNALLHMRTLQALDGTLAGASHREVAEVLCGPAAVSERWEPDSDLRAQVRRLIRRGRALMTGGYRRLLRRP